LDCISLLRITVQTNTVITIRLQVIYKLRSFTRNKQPRSAVLL